MDGQTHILCTPAVRAILFKRLTHALQAPMRVNVTSERIPTHPGIKVKSDRAYGKYLGDILGLNNDQED